jgi:hypothetical protein
VADFIAGVLVGRFIVCPSLTNGTKKWERQIRWKSLSRFLFPDGGRKSSDKFNGRLNIVHDWFLISKLVYTTRSCTVPHRPEVELFVLTFLGSWSCSIDVRFCCLFGNNIPVLVLKRDIFYPYVNNGVAISDAGGGGELLDINGYGRGVSLQ